MSKADHLRISGDDVPPGKQVRGELDVAELADGPRVRLPLLLINGARYYRQRGIPAIVYGPTLYNMAAADEHVTIADLTTVFRVLGLCAFDYMLAGAPCAHSGMDQNVGARQ